MRVIEADPTLANRPELGSGVSQRAHALKQRLVSELSLAELAFCLRQGIAVGAVAQRAAAALATQPLVQAEAYPGDLLSSLLHAAQNGSAPAAVVAELWDICSAALAGAESIQESVVPAARAFVGQRHGT